MAAAGHIPTTSRMSQTGHVPALAEASLPSNPTVTIESGSPTPVTTPCPPGGSNPQENPTGQPLGPSTVSVPLVVPDLHIAHQLPRDVGSVLTPAPPVKHLGKIRVPPEKCLPPPALPPIAEAAAALTPSAVTAGNVAAASAKSASESPPTFAQIASAFSSVGVKTRLVDKEKSRIHGFCSISDRHSRPLASSAMRDPATGHVVGVVSNAVGMGSFGKFLIAVDPAHPETPAWAVKKIRLRDHDLATNTGKQLRVDQKLAALKMLGTEDPIAGPRQPATLDSVVNEVAVHNMVYTDDTARFHTVWYCRDKVYICEPLMRGSLCPQEGMWGNSFHRAFSPTDRQIILDGLLAQIARQLKRCHELRIVFRDVKPPNILLNEHGEPMLADFGLAVRIPDGAADTSGRIGSHSYMAPSVLLGQRYDTKVDWFSLGVTCLDLLPKETLDPAILDAFVTASLESTFGRIFSQWHADHVIRDDKGAPTVDFAKPTPAQYSSDDRQAYRAITHLFRSLHTIDSKLAVFLVGKMMVVDPAHCASDDDIVGFFQSRYLDAKLPARMRLQQRFTQFVRDQSEHLTRIQDVLRAQPQESPASASG